MNARLITIGELDAGRLEGELKRLHCALREFVGPLEPCHGVNRHFGAATGPITDTALVLALPEDTVTGCRFVIAAHRCTLFRADALSEGEQRVIERTTHLDGVRRKGEPWWWREYETVTAAARPARSRSSRYRLANTCRLDVRPRRKSAMDRRRSNWIAPSAAVQFAFDLFTSDGQVANLHRHHLPPALVRQLAFLG